MQQTIWGVSFKQHRAKWSQVAGDNFFLESNIKVTQMWLTIFLVQ